MSTTVYQLWARSLQLQAPCYESISSSNSSRCITRTVYVWALLDSIMYCISACSSVQWSTPSTWGLLRLDFMAQYLFLKRFVWTRSLTGFLNTVWHFPPVLSTHSTKSMGGCEKSPVRGKGQTPPKSAPALDSWTPDWRYGPLVATQNSQLPLCL